MKLEIDIDEDYYKIICKRVEENKPYHSPYEYEVIADGKPLEQETILDKVRAEIEGLQKMCNADDLNLMAQHHAFGMALDVIDKYKADRSEEE